MKTLTPIMAATGKQDKKELLVKVNLNTGLTHS